MNKKEARLRRARQTRIRIAQKNIFRLVVGRSNQHTYAQVYSEDGASVLASASTVEKSIQEQLSGKSGGNIEAAKVVGLEIAKRAKVAGINVVAFDRSGFRFHGRVKALADAAREAGLEF